LMIFVLSAFAMAYYVALPPIQKYRHSMIIFLVLGGSVYAIALGVFLLNLYHLLYDLHDWWKHKANEALGQDGSNH
jgi:hypothetical protein